MAKRQRKTVETAETSAVPAASTGIVLPVIFALAVAGSFCVMFNAFWIFCFSSTDSFWLVQTGIEILARAHLPAGDIFSFTNNGMPWVIYQWLFEVVCGVLDRVGGFLALQASVFFVAALLFMVLAVRGMTKDGVGFILSWLVCISAMQASLTFVTLRPQLLSMLFMYIVQRALDCHWQRPGYKLLLLVPLFLVWGNCHIMFAVGVLVLFMYWLSSIVSRLVRRGAEGGEWRSKRMRILGGTSLLAVWAAFINPYGTKIVDYGLAVSSDNFWTRKIGEVMLPEFNDPLMVWILSYVMLTVLSFMLSTRRPSLPEGWTFIALLGMGLMSYKCLPFFIAASMHGTAVRVQNALPAVLSARLVVPSWLAGANARLTGWSLHPAYACGVLALALFFGLSHSPLFPPWVPGDAANFLSRHNVGKRLFCSAKFGSFLIYRFHGQVPIFIDTRFDMYGPEFSQRYFACNQRGIGWQELFRDYKVDGAFVEAGSGIAAVLAHTPGWQELYRDQQAVIFAPVGTASESRQSKTDQSAAPAAK